MIRVMVWSDSPLTVHVRSTSLKPFDIRLCALFWIPLLWFNLVRVEIHGLRPEVVTEDDDVLVHY